jgi:putative addiction module component (TIGR02574 family)
MSDKAAMLIEEARGLPYDERAQLVDELLATLEPEKENGIDEAWVAEVEKRGAELANGTVKPIIWEEVRKKALSLVHG